MLFRPYPGKRDDVNLLAAIAPIFRYDLERGEVELIGTGFWVTKLGHLVTAWHVIDENIGKDGEDRGPLFVVQLFADGTFAARNFKQSDKHPVFDLAMSQTVAAPPGMDQPTTPIDMTLDRLTVGDRVFSFAVLAHDQKLGDEAIEGHTPYRFSGEIGGSELQGFTPLNFAIRLSEGYVTEIYPEKRDSVMLNFPCIQTDLGIYGGNSGGPLFDVRGRICGAHCSSIEGLPVAFHVPIVGVLDLQTNAESLGLAADSKSLMVVELALKRQVAFDPPILDYDRRVFSVLRWLWYAAKCLLRREFPSRQIQFATFKSPRNAVANP